MDSCKVRIISDEIYQNPIQTLNTQIKETYNQNQKHNQVSYYPIPLSRQNFNNTGQNTTNDFTKNMQQQTVKNSYSFNTNNATSISQQSNINENIFYNVTQESKIHLMKNDMQHKGISETITSTTQSRNIQPLENEKQLLHNLQPSFSNVAFVNANPLLDESSQIQELGNTAPINNELFQIMQQIQLENNAPLVERREGNKMQVIEIHRDLTT